MEIKRNEVELISKKLNECRRHLQFGRMYACLLAFKETLGKAISTPMLASDKKHITTEINTFQQQLAGSQHFKNIFGPVTFMDDDMKTTLDFIDQLVVVEEEEIINRNLIAQNESPAGAAAPVDTDQLLQRVILLMDMGQHEKAREIYADDKGLRPLILHHYNRSGINYRKEGCLDEALGEFNKALLVEPEDEGLYYNTARTFIEKKDWQKAKEAILTALKINQDFKEGQTLWNYIKQKTDPNRASG